MPYKPMDDTGRAHVQEIVDKLTEVGEAIGSWTSNADVRRKGVSVHVTWENDVDVLTTATEFYSQLNQAPALLADACRKLLAADAALVDAQTQAATGGVRAALWHQVAETLAAELEQWGKGDMHYGTTPQAPSVVAALAVFTSAKETDR